MVTTRRLVPARRAAFDRVYLAPLPCAGHAVTVRSIRFSDYRRWREIRLRDQKLIEPYWTSSPLSWADRHSDAQWVRECLHQKYAARRRQILPLAIEIDGEFAGECSLYCGDGDGESPSAEIGIWLDSLSARHGIGVLAGAMVTDYGMKELGLHRVSAPICVDNHPAAHSAERGGMVREATMMRCLDVGGQHKDHELWAVTADQAPPDGYTAAVMRDMGADPSNEPTPLQGRPALRERLHHTLRDLPNVARAAVTAARFSVGAPRRIMHDHPNMHVPAQLGPVDIPTVSPTGDAAVRRIRLVDALSTHEPSYVGRRLKQSLVFDFELDGQRAGRLELCHLDSYHRTAELRALIDWAAADVDSAASACKLLSEYAFGDLKLVRLYATVPACGDRSTELMMQQAGMSKEGTMSGAGVDSGGEFVDLDLWAKTSDGSRVH